MIFYSLDIIILTQNWLSILTGTGYASFLNVSRAWVSSPTIEILSRSRLVIAGILGIVFSIGIFNGDGVSSHRLGDVFAGLSEQACSLHQPYFPSWWASNTLQRHFTSVLLIFTAILLVRGRSLTYLITVGLAFNCRGHDRTCRSVLHQLRETRCSGHHLFFRNIHLVFSI